MRWLLMLGSSGLFAIAASGVHAQESQTASVPASTAEGPQAPLPDVRALLADVERNQKQLEALQRDYTYHVHLEQQELDNGGGVKKTETQDAESLTVSGVRVDRIVARNGKPLSPEEQTKENERIDKVVAKAKERQAKLESKGSLTDQR